MLCVYMCILCLLFKQCAGSKPVREVAEDVGKFGGQQLSEETIAQLESQLRCIHVYFSIKENSL
jgi:hypothetical protein